MKTISDIWTLVYKEEGDEPLAFSYTSNMEANVAYLMVVDSDGGELFDEHENVVGVTKIEWCYLIKGKLINSF
jgi:hypothetical protein